MFAPVADAGSMSGCRSSTPPCLKDSVKAANILETIGNTPHIRVNRLFGAASNVWIKSERANPGGSIKDRIALSMIEDAEATGKLRKGGTIIEPTSGNTGIGLAMVAAVKGYPLVLVMPDSMSTERRRLMLAYGAKFVLTPRAEGMKGAIAKAQQLTDATPNSWMPQQFDNPANPAIHEATTGPELWNDTDGKMDIFVAGVGTGGTITGVGRFWKPKKPSLQIIAVEPANSSVISGGAPGPHKIQGLGAGFIPKNLDMAFVDGTFQVSNEESFGMARRLAKEEGILGGISSGAAAHAAIEIAKRPESAGKLIVFVIPDTSERYISTDLFKEEDVPSGVAAI